MGGAGDEKGSAEEEDKKKGTEEDEKDQVVKAKPKLVIKMSKTKAAPESQSSKSQDDVISAPPPLNQSPPKADSDLSQVEPALKKLRTWVEETYSKPPPPTSDVIDFGPFSPTMGTPPPKKRLRFKMMARRGKASKPKRLLEPPRVTYLRPRPRPDTDDPNKPMGPPPEPREITTPYQTVKNALTFLKNDLGIFARGSPPRPPREPQLLEPAQIQDAAKPGLPENLLSMVTPALLFSLEEVVMELDLYLKLIPETESSSEMTARLLQFQIRLGLPAPPHPLFYNLLWKSPTDFKNYLAEKTFGSDGHDGDEERGGNAVAVSDEAGGDKVEVVDANAEAGSSDHRPPPALSFNDAMGIVLDFADGIKNNAFEPDENAFLNLQCHLQLPELPQWLGLYQLYQSESMEHVIQFVMDNFQPPSDVRDEAVVVDDTADANAVAGPSDHLPPPVLSFDDSMKLVCDFANRIKNNDFEPDEKAFLNLQCDLQLPEWIDLYEIYRSESMEQVTQFVRDNFQPRQQARRPPSDVRDEAGGNKVEVADDTADANAVAGTYDHLPPPVLSLDHAMGILRAFSDRMLNDDDFKPNENAFLSLQCDLQLPEWLGLYELYLSKSMVQVTQFVKDYFGQARRPPSDVRDEAGCDKVEDVDDTADSTAVAGPYDHLPPPALSLDDAMKIVCHFANRIRKGKICEPIENAFLNLQCELQLPEWLGLYEIYRSKSMEQVTQFVKDYFGQARSPPNDVRDEAGGDKVEEAGGDKVEDVDDTAHAIAVAGPLPPPALSLDDSMKIVCDFANRIGEGEICEPIENAFLNLQCELQLPEWIGLYEIYRSKSMEQVVRFVKDYFGSSRQGRSPPS